ncbi:MAG: helix-turn-helix domain-containing protein [Burkholderiaceae bacterium]
MTQRHSSDFLRTCRRSAGLTQSEVSRLMGFQSRTHLSRMERGKRIPRLEQALRYEYLFGVPLQKIAPNLCNKALNGLWENIEDELRSCERRTDPKSRRKYDMLSRAKERIEATHS